MPDSLTQAERNNQHLWDEVARVHFQAYTEVEILKQGGCALDEIELREIGEVQGKSLLHLQCHIGTDTLSWARRGALVTGVDFSEESLACAQQLQRELDLPARFVQSNIYDLPGVLHGQFDIVYTSRGVLCWLRDLEAWAQVIAHYLKPGGIFYIMESHPLMNIFEEVEPGDLSVKYPYFHDPEPTIWDDDDPDYADPAYVPQHASFEWNWSISDILSALLNAGLKLELFNEYERLFFKAYPSMVVQSDRWYDFPRYSKKLPWIFTLRARKPADQGK